MIDFIAPAFLLSALIFLIHRAVRRASSDSSPRKGLAPSHRLSRPDATPGWHLERKGTTVSVWTSSLNQIPAAILHRRGARTRAIWRLGYDLGILVGIGGMLVGLGGLVWSAGAVWKEVWREAELHARLKEEAAHVMRRALGEDMPAVGLGDVAVAGAGPGIQPLIPGVTIPLSHFPTLVLAFIVNQLLHELGHAISGAIDDIQMSRFAFNFHVLFPSATVTFPSSIDSLSTRAKLRLTTAGPLHNFITYLALLLLAGTGLPRLFWTDQSANGVAIYSVSPASPLYGHVSAGDIITHVDDVFMGHSDGVSVWERYMSSETVGDAGKGWCVDRNVYMSLQNPPCPPMSGTVIFEPLEPIASSASPRGQVKCLQTHPVLQIPSASCPCPSAKWICVHPNHEEQIVRIRLGREHETLEGENSVILFSGDRRELLESVEVGRMRARFFGSLIRWESMFLKYMSTVALSLFIFNLLPLPHTDGSSLLRSLLSLKKSSRLHLVGIPILQATLAPLSAKAPSINLSRQYELNSDDEDEYDEERGRNGRDGDKREEAWKRRVRRGAEGTVMGLGVIWASGWGMLSLLKSS